MHSMNLTTRQSFLNHDRFHNHLIEVGAKLPIDNLIEAHTYGGYDILEDFPLEQGMRDSDDGFWAGIKLPEEIIWPEEKTTWTSAGVILAATSILQQSN